MANDFKKKEPNKTEKVLYELFMQQQGMERNLITNSALLISLAMLLKIEPEKLAETLVNNETIKEYSGKVNATIEKLELEKRAKEQSEKPADKIEDQKA